MSLPLLQVLSFTPEFHSRCGKKALNLQNPRRHSTAYFGSEPRNRIPDCTKPLLQPPPPSAAASSSISGSPSETPEQWLDERKKRRRQRVAGIYQDELLDPALLADPDSCFCEFQGIKIHHKVCDAVSQTDNLLENEAVSRPFEQMKRIGLPMILLHGFGASVFSWNQVMKPLAQISGSKVLAFDRPAFGLTSREHPKGNPSHSNNDTRPLNPYSMAFAILATLYFIDFLGAEKAILVGHSAGSLVAVNSYFKAPERVAALILVAPAILPPLFAQSEDQKPKGGKNLQRDSSNYATDQGSVKFFKMFADFFKYISKAISQVVKGMGDMLNALYKRAVSAILRSAVGVVVIRMIIDKFGVAAIQSSWYDSSKVNDHVLHGYTKPLRTKGWDRALLEFTAAMLTDSAHKSELAPLAQRLKEISCPVMLITGDSDRLVPRWNTERLSRAIPGSCLEVIKNSGHLPHEESPEEFLEAVQNFLQRVVGASRSNHCEQANEDHLHHDMTFSAQQAAN